MARLPIAFICLVVYGLSVWVREFWTIDDALIFQNFVRNFVDGNGLVYSAFNPVEGYSSPLWVLLLGMAGKLGFQGLLTAKAVGILFGLATVVSVAMLLPTCVPRRLCLLGGLLVALQPSLAWWSVSGMETPMVTFLVTAMVLAIMHRRLPIVAAAAGLLAIARPEGLMYTAVAVVWMIFSARSGRLERRALIAGIIASGLPIAAWQLFRLVRYGTLIANSALAKLGTDIGSQAGGSAGAALHYLADSVARLPSLWIVVIVATALTYKHLRSQIDEVSAVVYGLVYLTIIFVLVAGGDWMPWHRFLLPIVPTVIVWGILIADRSQAEARQAVAAALAFAVLATLVLQHRDFFAEYTIHLPSRYEMVARWPDERTPLVEPVAADPVSHFYAGLTWRFTRPGDAVLHADVGQPGYLTDDIEILDAFGLVSRFEAEYLQGWRTPDELIAHFREKDLALVFLWLDRPDGEATMNVAAPLVGEVRSRYVPVAWSQWSGNTAMVAYARPEAVAYQPDLDRLEQWIERARGVQFDDDVLRAIAEKAGKDEAAPALISVFSIADELGWYDHRR